MKIYTMKLSNNSAKDIEEIIGDGRLREKRKNDNAMMKKRSNRAHVTPKDSFVDIIG